MFHNHCWKEIARTYAPPQSGNYQAMSEQTMLKINFGVTTILWECEDQNCKQIRKEELLGKGIEYKRAEESKEWLK